jgi:hypothetical protein
MAFVALIGFAFFAFLPVLHNEFSWERFAGRVVLSLPVGVFAAYAAAQADRYMEIERRNRKLALALEALGPYLAPLPEDQQHQFRLELGSRTFGRTRDRSGVEQNEVPQVWSIFSLARRSLTSSLPTSSQGRSTAIGRSLMRAPGKSVPYCEFCGTIRPEGQEACREEEALVEQITAILKQAETGRLWAISVAKPVSRSRRSIAGRKPMAGCCRRGPRAEAAARGDTRLKRVVADLTLDKVMLQDVVQKCMVTSLQQPQGIGVRYKIVFASSAAEIALLQGRGIRGEYDRSWVCRALRHFHFRHGLNWTADRLQ